MNLEKLYKSLLQFFLRQCFPTNKSRLKRSTNMRSNVMCLNKSYGSIYFIWKRVMLVSDIKWIFVTSYVVVSVKMTTRDLLVSILYACDLSLLFMRFQNFVTLFMILCESCNVKDVTNITSHVFADTIILWITI